jgi:hypothetical protein
MGDEDGRRLDEQVFAVRLTLPDGSSRKVQCDADTNVEQILQAVSSKVSLLPLGQSARRDRSPLCRRVRSWEARAMEVTLRWRSQDEVLTFPSPCWSIVRSAEPCAHECHARRRFRPPGE